MEGGWGWSEGGVGVGGGEVGVEGGWSEGGVGVGGVGVEWRRRVE